MDNELLLIIKNCKFGDDGDTIKIYRIISKLYLVESFKSLFLNKNEKEIMNYFDVVRKLDMEDNKDILYEFSKLLPETWHRKHEYIIHFIQRHKVIEAVPLIEKAMSTKFEYMTVNIENYYSFFRKCMFALGDIGTLKAKQIILSYIENEDLELRKYAKEQVNRHDNMSI